MKESKHNKGRLKQWYKKACCSLVGVLAFLLIAEVGLRIRQKVKYGTAAVPAWLKAAKPDVSVWHPFLRSIPKPSAKWSGMVGKRELRIEFNSLGFRSGEIQQEKSPGTFRVVCVGGSVAYDTRVNMDESWPVKLEGLLRDEFPGKSIEVVNAAIPGRTSADSLVNVGLRVLPLSPDAVVVMHGVNDQKPNRCPGFKPDYSHWYGPQFDRPVEHSTLHGALDRSLLASHVRHRLRNLKRPTVRDGDGSVRRAGRHDTVGKDGLECYRRNLESIIAMCRAQDARVVIATVGESLDENGDWHKGLKTQNPLLAYHPYQTFEGLKDGFRQYNRVSREVAESRSCILVDIAKLLPKGRAYYQDDVHYTSAGSKRIADIFLEQVSWQDLIR